MPSFIHPSRRSVLKGAAAASVMLAAPVTLRAQPVIVRKSLATSDAESDVATYREAVKFMLTQAEPDDPQTFHLNWYRNAMIHLLDCPHGNWWFAVWHRPYLAYLEQKIRQITGNVEFALPFWDWTVQPFIPPAFLSDPSSPDPDIQDNPLDPGSSHYANASHNQPLKDAADMARGNLFQAWSAFNAAQNGGDATAIALAQAAFVAASQAHDVAKNALLDHTFPAFDAKYRAAFEAVWNTFTPAQLAQLTTRFGPADGQASVDFEVFWTGSSNSVRENYDWDAGTARILKLANPALTGRAEEAIKKDNIDSSVRSPHFALRADQTGGDQPGFGFNTIDGDTHHSMSRTQAILEGQPHNAVHNATGAVMQSNLSSIDPIFFMHHANVDRVWDVWTRRQMGLTPAGPHLPEHDAAKFNAEEFLFYIQPDGAPVTTDITAGTFMDRARFGYGYASGTGEDQIQSPMVFANVVTERVSPQMALEGVALDVAPSASLALNAEQSSVFDKGVETPNVLAEITTTLPQSVAGLSLEIFVSPRGEVADTSDGSLELAGAVEFFGMNETVEPMHGHGADETAVFDVDITDAITRLTEMGVLEPGAEIDVTMAPVRTFGSVRNAAPGDAVLQSVRLKTI